ncbi:MAG: EF-hand domain-containing protein [Verrucomicrobiota bacterium]|nr:EF-hand domain-containing protein [Verrucomicrobiota bacterium]
MKFINNIKARILTSLATVLVVGCNTTTKILDTKGEQPRLEGIASLKPKEIVNLLGAKIWEDVNERQIENYRRVFGFGDTDKDGRHSKKEYIENGRYMTPKARQGIFRASDTNNDGFVTEAEYVENRIITDEAKIIFDEMDADLNGKLTKFEFLNAGLIKNQQLAKEIFEALDTNNNGELIIPEYLRVWGKWARNISP